MKVPTGALFRDSEEWVVFVVAGGHARKRVIHVERRSGLEAVVEKGIVPGEYVIVYPSDAVHEGVRVAT
ncbi:MAG TPA: hypothetical protein VGX03_33575 [Candidatus Binatia bacterium]|nr:hypothetical protein [Candidatus Binatia bacterium]